MRTWRVSILQKKPDGTNEAKDLFSHAMLLDPNGLVRKQGKNVTVAKHDADFSYIQDVDREGLNL